MPMFEMFTSIYQKAYHDIKTDSNDEYSWGEIATYIPPLAKADPDWFATSYCSTDEQFASFGDNTIKFSI